jgi:predicted neutral ceramidase superfamily lipid hydrolase
MTQTFHIEREKRQTWHERLRKRWRAVVDIDPTDLFNLFYVLFGFTITCSLFAACFLSFTMHREYLTMLFESAAASTVLWGIAYAAWTDRLKWAWATLTAVATLGMIAGIFVVLTQSGMADLLRELIIVVGALPALWAITIGLRKIDW